MTSPRMVVLLVASVVLADSPAEAQFADGFGTAVGVVDGSLVVLKPNVGIGRAGAYTFRWASGGWQGADAFHPVGHEATGDGYGGSLSVAPNLLVIAAGDPHARWAAHLFERTAPATWSRGRIPLVSDAVMRTQPAMSLATLAAISAPPRRTVAISPDGALLAVSGGGPTVHLFQREDGGPWFPAGELSPDVEQVGDAFGMSLAVDMHHDVFVGAPDRDGAGAVFVFAQEGDAWVQRDVRSAARGAVGSRYGAALAIAEGGVLVGAPGGGEVHFIARGAGATSPPPIEAPDEVDGFGASLAADGGEIWIGAPGTDGGRGAVYRVAGIQARWGEVLGRLQVDDLSPGDGFGAAVAIDGGLGVVGAPFASGGRGGAVAYRWAKDRWSDVTWLDAGTELTTPVTGTETNCEEGTAGGFDCDGVDLLAFVPLRGLGAGEDESVSDLWGWTDPETGREYALVGRSTGAVIVDITEPSNPLFLGTVGGNRTHARDIKVYKDHMFFTGDGAGDHGLLIFDLARVRDVTAVPVEWEPDARYDGIASAHNLIINTETGFGFTVGNRAGGTTCGGGLHMVDLNDPLNPVFAGCYTDTEGLIWQGRTHDAQCVIYHGPDEEYLGREICFALNETAVRIVDVTEKDNPIPISAGRYPGLSYVHQGWLTEDHRYFYQNDEADELTGMTDRTRTMIWNVEDLDDPVVVAEHLGPNNATDHNLYIVGNRMYQANYHAGMRVLDISDRAAPVEIAFFDTTPYGGDPPGYTGGAWSVYPFFESGTVIVSSMNEGLFILRPGRPILP
jgi:choice-of-anchor B domain-containing protein